MNPTSVARLLLHLAADLLSPRGCAACDARAEHVFCGACAASIVRVHAPATDAPALHAFAEFGGAVAEAVRRFKYAGRTDLARPLGDLVRRAAREARLEADMVVPVPLHPRRLADRGYNQAALLGRHAARELDAAFAPRALLRSRDTPRQASLDRAARRTNVARAFAARGAAAIAGRRIVLVDDVATTGATLQACADALLAGGAASVTGLVLARTTAVSR